MQLTCWENANTIRNATCANTQISNEWSYCSFLYCAQTDLCTSRDFAQLYFCFSPLLIFYLINEIHRFCYKKHVLTKLICEHFTPTLVVTADSCEFSCKDLLKKYLFCTHCQLCFRLCTNATAINLQLQNRCCVVVPNLSC